MEATHVVERGCTPEPGQPMLIDVAEDGPAPEACALRSRPCSPRRIPLDGRSYAQKRADAEKKLPWGGLGEWKAT